TASIGLQALPISLSDATSFSGRAFACVGFASDGNAGTCPTASPLHTDKGDFFIALPYDLFELNNAPRIGDALRVLFGPWWANRPKSSQPKSGSCASLTTREPFAEYLQVRK